MTSRAQSDLLLVGSLPAESTEAAFRAGAELFGDLVFALPHGETGPRAAWVGYEREHLCRPHPDVVVVKETESPTGIPRHAYETPIFAVREGVSELHWDSWPRIDDAIASYREFADLREQGVIAWTEGDAWERFAGPAKRLTPLIPEEVLVGYHLCYGTFPEWPMYETQDLSVLVRMANYAVAESGRAVDWLHLAGPRYLRSEDERFFAPLAELDPGPARVFLGIVLPLDGVPGLRRRHATASRYLDDFGVAMYCGFGRQPGRDGMATMREHRRVVREVVG
jgi:hypothetical protein